jgi:hypothetical protein
MAARHGFWSRTGRIATWLGIALTALLPAVTPSAARALDSGGGKWEPGTMLVRFNRGVGAAERKRVVSRAGTRLGPELPLVPELFEVTTRDKVERALARLDAQPGVNYAQPNYLESTAPNYGPGLR